MRIVSLNAWGGAMFDALVAWLSACEADVLCVQEVTSTPGSSGWTVFTDGERSLPQRANLFHDLRALLPRHQASFLAVDAGPVNLGGQTKRQDFGLAMFVADHVPVVALGSGFIHGAFVDHDVWPTGNRPRAGQAIRAVDRASSRYVTILHAHGLRDPAGKHDTPARVAQAMKLVETLASVRREGDLTLVCGDLNVLPDSETFAVLAAAGLRDLVGRADTRTSRYPKQSRSADYLLVSDPEAVRTFEIVAEPEISDHRPLVVEI